MPTFTWTLVDVNGAASVTATATATATATVGTAVTFGSISVSPVSGLVRVPVARIAASPEFGVVGSVVKLDGRGSTDPDNLPLTYTWSFVSVPIGSRVGQEGFRTLDTETDTDSPSLVSFSPDVVGEYVIGLMVSNGTFDSLPVSTRVSIRAILVPHGRGIIPDGKFIWTMIRDMWTEVDGKEWFETLWSALIQIVGTEMLKLYQVDFNKSIRDIQDRFQRRWLAYEPKLELSSDDLTFYFGNHCVGQDATTVNLGLEGRAVILSANEVIVILGSRLQNVVGEEISILYSLAPANISTFDLQGVNTTRNGYKLSESVLDPTADRIATTVLWSFAIGSTAWHIESGTGTAGIQVGDVVYYPNGPNAGFYRILTRMGADVTVEHAPPSFSTPLTVQTSTVYRPVGFTITQPAMAQTDTFAVPYTPGDNDLSKVAPGRIVVVGGQAFTIVRSVVDLNQLIPLTVVTVDKATISAGLQSLNWRAPHTLISDSLDFEALGVTTGDLLVFGVSLEGSQTTSDVRVQVVGVDGDRLGFVLTDEAVVPGVVPEIPDKVFQSLATDFVIPTVSVTQVGELVFADMALDFFTILNSGKFASTYWNKPTTPSTEIKVNPTFFLTPQYIIRNRYIPVDETLRSVPILQEFIVQPSVVERDGKYFQQQNDKEFELWGKPVILTENLEYLIDDEFPFEGLMAFDTGTTTIQVDDADFVARGINSGDSFIIESPITLAGTYLIDQVLSNTELRLTRQVPLYSLGLRVNAQVLLQRKRIGHFLRFTPGTFTSLSPAPPRLWSEVSFFDNSQTIEDNFGLLVGLTKADLDSISKDINYRQAVAGMMFAFTRGSSIDRVRLGAQILLGLPFAEHRGIIRSIEEDYRLDLDGNPIQGRLLIEDVDTDGTALGTMRIYLYPIDLPSELAGIETSPVTGETYVVGDTVALFAPLSKGVVVDDYLTVSLDQNNTSVQKMLQQFHSIRLRINDNIFTLKEISLVSTFLRKITPSYISFVISSLSEFADNVTIEDGLDLSLGWQDATPIIDNASLNVPPVVMFDSKNLSGIPQAFVGDSFYWVRRSGRDLVTADDSALATCPSGGFLNPRTGESFAGSLVRAGDFLYVIGGVNNGLWTIGSVSNDATLLISDVPGSSPHVGFRAGVGQRFAVLRRLSHVIQTGSVTLAIGSNVGTTVGGNMRVDGVAPGDWFISGSGRSYVTRVGPTPGYTDPWTAVVYPSLSSTQIQFSKNSTVTGTFAYQVVRPAFFQNEEGTTVPVTSTGANKLTVFADLPLLGEVRDELLVDDSSRRRVIVLDPANGYVTPALPAGTYDVFIMKPNHPDGTIGADHILKFDPIDEATMGITETRSLGATTNTSPVVTLQQAVGAGAAGAFNPDSHGVLPGDSLVLSGGTVGSVDVGFGPGIYPIVQVSSTTITVSKNLTATESRPWQIIRRR